MSRFYYLIMIVCLVVVSSGCRNNGSNPFGVGNTAGTTIAPPPTYSLRIPSVARNQPYYAPGSPQASAINPNAPAPMPGVAPNPQPGWGATAGPATLPPGANLVATNGGSPSSFVETGTGSARNGNSGVRTASLPGSGVSYTQSTNYRTTQTDERGDSTRLALSDASSVRAPSSYTAVAVQNRGPASYSGGAPYPVQQTHVSQNSPSSGPAPFGARGVLVAQPAAPSPNFYRGQAVMVNQQNYPGNGSPAVLSQSTAVVSPQPQAAGWQSPPGNSTVVQ